MYDVGSTVTLAAPVVLDADGVPHDATTHTLTITQPDQTTAVGAVVGQGDGKYFGAHVAGQYGRHVARWAFSGGVPAQSYADVFNVADPAWPAIVGTAEARQRLGYAADDGSDDDGLRLAILCVTQVIEDITGDVIQRTIVEIRSGGERVVLLRHRPVLEVIQVKVDGSIVDPSTYQVSEHGILYATSGRWPRGVRNVEVTYRAGRVATSPATLDAALELIRINARPRLGGNFADFDGEGGDDDGASRSAEGALQGEMRLGWFIPNTVMQRLQPTARAPHIA